MMRDILTRILAIEWIYLLLTAIYGILFAVSVTSLEFYFSNVNPSSPIKLSIGMFLFGRLISSFVLLIGLLADTDVTLCLGYFGCMGFCMLRLREYTRRKRDEYKGWPLPFLYNKYRFYIWTAVKALDFIWGIIGWIVVISSIGKIFSDSNLSIRAMTAAILLVMIITDIWTPVLVYGAHWLIKEYEEMLDDGEDAGDSDDSELDEFGVRTPLTSPVKKTHDKKSIQSPAVDEDSFSDDDEDSREDESSQSSPRRSSVTSSVHSPMVRRSSASIEHIQIDIDDNLAFTKENDFIRTAPSQEFKVVLDPSATVSAEDFADMWGVLSTLGDFKCKVKPNFMYMRESSLPSDTFGFQHVVEHLQNMGFFIVAAGDKIWDEYSNSVISKLYAYTLGYSSTSIELATPIYYLLELKMLSLNTGKVEDNDILFEIICTNKCTKREYIAAFVEELNFGCVFDLQFEVASL